MQTKKSSEQVLARRLRPIYDAVDASQYKKAILEADKVLKKHPQTYTAKALKALALIRTDRSNEALPVLGALEGETFIEDFDENTVQALCHCYKELNTPERIVALYRALVKRYPANERLARELFCSHVRTRDFRQQQQVAMQLYKDTKDVQYYCWALMSVLMQGYADPKLGVSMFFPLAEKMLEKMVSTYSEELHQVQGGIDLHLLVLESRKKYAEAIQLIETSANQTADSHSEEHTKQRLDHLHRLAADNDAIGNGKWSARALDDLEKDPSELSNWRNLAECIEGNVRKREAEGQQAEIISTQLLGRLSPLLDAEGGETNRAILHGRLVLMDRLMSARILTSQQIAESPLGSPLVALSALADVVCQKPYGFADLSPFFNTLLDREEEEKTQKNDVSQQKRLLDYVATSAKDGVWPRLLWEQLAFRHRLPATLDDDHLGLAIQRVLSKFVLPNREDGSGGQQLDGVQMTTAMQLLIQYWWEQYTRSGKPEVLLAMLAFLEWIWARHEDCTAYIPIALCRLYGMFGDVQRIEELERQIQLKFMQRDSLAFLHFFTPYQFGRFKCANLYYTSLGAMYEMNEREVNECLVAAYRNHAFTQIPKLVDFARRSSNSLFSLGAELLGRCISACFVLGSDMAAGTLRGDEQNQQIDWHTVADNRDFSVFPPIIDSQKIARIKEYSFKEMRHFFKLKHCLLQAIGHIGTEKLEQKADDFSQALEECGREFGKQDGGMESHLESYVNLGLPELMASKLFELPSEMLVFGIGLAHQLKDSPSGTGNGLDANLAQFSAHIQGLHAFYSRHSALGLDDRSRLLTGLATAVEMLALCLVGHKLMEDRVAAEQQRRTPQMNGTAPTGGGGTGKKPAEKQLQKNPLLEPINARVQLIGEALRRVHSHLCANFKGASIKTGQLDLAQLLLFPPELLPANVEKEIGQKALEVVASINKAHSGEELKEAIGHLLFAHCAIDIQRLSIQQGEQEKQLQK